MADPLTNIGGIYMKAAVIKKWGEPLVIEDVPIPTIGPGEVLVKINLSGVCHTDLHLWKGVDWPKCKAIMEAMGVNIVGHEGAGVVKEVGPGVTLVKPGDRVAVGWFNYVCGVCENCMLGYPHWCKNVKYTTVHVPGTFAEYVKVHQNCAIKIPDGVRDEWAGPIACGGGTSYGAVRKLVSVARLPQGKWVAIVGAAGGLGHMAVQIAKAFGYRVVGIDLGPKRVEFVERLGVDLAVDATRPEEAIKTIKEKTGGGVHAVVCETPSIKGYDLALKILRTPGFLVVVGLPPEAEGPIPLTPFDAIVFGIHVIPSLVAMPYEYEEVFDLILTGKLKIHVEAVEPLENINKIFKELEERAYVGRKCVKP
jgi:propanol-preferring alcohol dehydrogenase